MHDQIFDLLDDWRQLPKYQLERRADIFFARYLPQIIESRFGHKTTCIIPEFPLMRGLYDAVDKNQFLSSNIDYLVVCEEDSVVYFVELKTDMASKGDKQFERMKSCSKLSLHTLLDGILQIGQQSKSKAKYNYLIDKLAGIGWLKKEGGRYIPCKLDYCIDLVYIQPKILSTEDHHVIEFAEIADLLKTFDDPLALRFAKSLYSWSTS